MHNFTAHRLRFVAEVVTPMGMDPYMGTGLRAAFFNALTKQFCANKPALSNGGCLTCPLIQVCPVAYLVATLNPDADRGQNVARPFTVEPPIWSKDDRRASSFILPPSSRFEFGLTIFAEALNLFPYVVLSLEEMGRQGLGQRLAENRGRRGMFRVQEVWAENPITGERHAVLEAQSRQVVMPDVPVTHAQVTGSPIPPPGSRVRVDFLTPMRLVNQNTPLMRAPRFRILFQRLMERLAALSTAFSDAPLDAALKYETVGLSDEVQLVEDHTRWLHLESPTSRLKGTTSISGFLGHADYQADDWAPFWPWLKWAEITHLGKNIVKGHGIVRFSIAD